MARTKPGGDFMANCLYHSRVARVVSKAVLGEGHGRGPQQARVSPAGVEGFQPCR
jgi:hypothetical protein